MLKFDDKTTDYECANLSKPSKEDYEKALRDMKLARDSLHMCRKRKDHLVDELCRERESEKLYSTCYERAREVIRKYEIYEELEAKNNT